MSTSEVHKFYKDQTVFITGGTGVVGKLLLRKLLTSCWQTKKIYLLLREKRGKTAEERLDILLDSYVNTCHNPCPVKCDISCLQCFQSLSQDRAEFKGKVSALSGDCCLPNLGLTPENYKMVQAETTCIIHTSACVRFDEELRLASYTNVRSVQSILEMARTTKNLKVI
jgi:fatty acyl-CoA reductase